MSFLNFNNIINIFNIFTNILKNTITNNNASNIYEYPFINDIETGNLENMNKIFTLTNLDKNNLNCVINIKDKNI
jgi:hypothetical protein